MHFNRRLPYKGKMERNLEIFVTQAELHSHLMIKNIKHQKNTYIQKVVKYGPYSLPYLKCLSVTLSLYTEPFVTDLGQTMLEGDFLPSDPFPQGGSPG